MIDPPKENLPQDASPQPVIVNHIHVHANSSAQAAAVAQANAGNALAGCLIFCAIFFGLPVLAMLFCGGMLGISATAVDQSMRQEEARRTKVPPEKTRTTSPPRSIAPQPVNKIEQPEQPVSILEKRLAEEQKKERERAEADRKNRTYHFRDVSGNFETDALFISRNGKTITLEKLDGKRITVSIDDLSSDSVEWIKNYKPLR